MLQRFQHQVFTSFAEQVDYFLPDEVKAFIKVCLSC